ncbi:AMP-binding protein [Aeromicrobium sp. HA]|uniref:AMP-binding protein n=1 Tax=Aeromicrobium sp. HA TaxID=3009077 RepID=UPI0022B01955|nr:AMP-binding protein [Aeromicrobium sp. HA]
MPDDVSVHTPEQQARYRASGAWSGITLGAAVRRWSQERPDVLAVVDGADGREATYRELFEDASRVAGWMIEQGVRPGSGVSVQLPSRYETVVVDLAALLVGARLNPLLPNYRHKELRHFLDVSRAKVYVTPDTYRGFDHLDLARRLRDEDGLSFTHLVVGAGGDADLTSVLRREPVTDLRDVDAEAISELIFTSGTESLPKAVMHTEETVNHSVAATVEHLGLGDDDVVWMPSPVGHSTGFNFGVRLALMNGVTVVLQDRWDPSRAAQLIEQYGCTYTLAASTFLSDLLRVAKKEGRDLSSMRSFGCGGAPVPAELVREAAALGVTVLRIYGSTEGLIIAWNQQSAAQQKREETDGLPPRGTEVQVWDGEGRQLPAGEVGELVVRGPNVCVGFFDDPERTSATFTEDGWLRSGDLGIVDEDGYVAVVGRKKETIIRGGLNIAPREIEDLLVEMPGVKEVAVIGLADDRLGEIVAACIVPDDGATPELVDVVEYLRSREMATYKLPQHVALVRELPKTPTGKVRKTELVSEVHKRRGGSA